MQKDFNKSKKLDWLIFPQIISNTIQRIKCNLQNKRYSIIRIFVLSIIVGFFAGLGAVLFYFLLSSGKHFFLGTLMGYYPSGAEGEVEIFTQTTQQFIPWLILFIPMIGGLLSGFLIFKFAPEAEGHGTDAAIDNFHHHGGDVKFKTVIVKIIASVLTIGSGGSGGQEGPIAQIGSGIGSNLAKFLQLSIIERRILMIAGMAAGVGAIFGAPMAGALFAAEVLYQELDFEYEAIIASVTAAIISHGVFSYIFETEYLFLFPELSFDSYFNLIPYSFLTVLVALGAIFFTRFFYWTRDKFVELPVSNYFKPAIGGLLTGIIGFIAFQLFPFGGTFDYGVITTGYGVVQEAIFGNLGLSFLIFVIVGKTLTTSFSIGSGGSGGVFGPSVVIGGAIGGAFCITLAFLFPELNLQPAAFVLVGIAGFFSAAANTPISTIIMVSEITGNFDFLVPAMWVSFLAYVIAHHNHLYENQIKNRFFSPVHKDDIKRSNSLR
jgi:CIC family chloride channel protein